MDERLIKYLNEQLVSEYEAVFNYLFHSVGSKDRDVREEFVKFSREELEHARSLINFIIKLGGDPVFVMPEVNKERDDIQMLAWAMTGKESAVKKYSMLKQLVEDPETKELFDRSIEVEEAHYERLKTMLGIKKCQKELVYKLGAAKE
jgi:bacterioferritin (cytochrome b1)